MMLSGWCSAPPGAQMDQYHQHCRWELCECPSHVSEPAQIKGIRAAAWENEASPQGALTPAGSNPSSILETNGG